MIITATTRRAALALALAIAGTLGCLGTTTSSAAPAAAQQTKMKSVVCVVGHTVSGVRMRIPASWQGEGGQSDVCVWKSRDLTDKLTVRLNAQSLVNRRARIRDDRGYRGFGIHRAANGGEIATHRWGYRKVLLKTDTAGRFLEFGSRRRNGLINVQLRADLGDFKAKAADIREAVRTASVGS